jgi:hypothetical protein
LHASELIVMAGSKSITGGRTGIGAFIELQQNARRVPAEYCEIDSFSLSASAKWQGASDANFVAALRFESSGLTLLCG